MTVVLSPWRVRCGIEGTVVASRCRTLHSVLGGNVYLFLSGLCSGPVKRLMFFFKQPTIVLTLSLFKEGFTWRKMAVMYSRHKHGRPEIFRRHNGNFDILSKN